MNHLIKTALMGSMLVSSSSFAAEHIALSSKLNTHPALDAVDQFNHKAMQVTDIKRVLANHVAKDLATQEKSWLHQLSNTHIAKLSALSLTQNNQQLMQQANARTRSLKGLEQANANLYQLRLASKDMLMQWQNGQQPLIAFAPKGDDKDWLYVEAFDAQGNLHLLDARILPSQPVLILELDSQQVKKEGLAVMQSIFEQARSQSPSVMLQQQSIQDTAISTSKLDRIRLNDDEEPWVSGKAEVYAVVTGVSPSRDEPVLDIVDMPYLDHDGTDYTPNQILIHWERYRWQAADVLLMEQDDNTNYQELATTFLDIVTQVMRAIPDPNVQGYAIIPQLTNQLIKAMPSHWFSNDDDYLDVFYTLFEGQKYTNHMGASNNAKITLSPLTINPRSVEPNADR
ncbi:MAG: hypothetical protein CMK64_11675 [Pseudoalteromonas sp.]|nr:hypothetical protein [Pseudoalteromonas sp.]|tara:strand:+ start:6331 stop:7527 length:1197 start_codon:yes stop_codon:yes gene_type:complete